MNHSPQIKPMTLWASLWFFGIPAVLLVLSMYVLMPYLEFQGLSKYMSYAWSLIIFLALMLAAALVAYRLEGNPPTWTALKERFRLRPMTQRDWLWVAGMFPIMVILESVLQDIGRWLIAQGWIPLPSHIPAMIDPRQSTTIDTMQKVLGGQVPGHWSLVLVALLLLVFNIIGEEFWWRGYILPRQELALGKYTWLVHGGLWTLFHVYKYWSWLTLLPLCFGIAFMAQRLKSTWPGVITHFLLNTPGIVLLVLAGRRP